VPVESSAVGGASLLSPGAVFAIVAA